MVLGDSRQAGESPFEQSGFDVRFDWGMEGLEKLAPLAKVVVIVDVFSFTTCVDVATSRGAVVLPYSGGHEDALKYGDMRDAVVAGHRGETEVEWSLSPASLQTIPEGTRLVLPSPNGSSLSFRAAETGTVTLAGCLRNASAVAAAAAAVGTPIAVVAAGERWERSNDQLRVAVEDLVGAGAIIASFSGLEPSPEAGSAEAAFSAARSLHDVLRSSGSGRELIERGFSDDIELAGAHDLSSNVPVLVDGCFEASDPGAHIN